MLLTLLNDDMIVKIDKFCEFGSLSLRETCKSLRAALPNLPLHMEILKICSLRNRSDSNIVEMCQEKCLLLAFKVAAIEELCRAVVFLKDKPVIWSIMDSLFIGVACGCHPDTPFHCEPEQSIVRAAEEIRVQFLHQIYMLGANPGYLVNVYNHVCKNAFLQACECNQLEVARFLWEEVNALDPGCVGIHYKAGGVNNAYACVLDRIESDQQFWIDEPDFRESVEMPDFESKYADMLAFLRDDVGLNPRPPRCESPAVTPCDTSDEESDDQSDEESDDHSDEESNGQYDEAV